MVRKMRSWKLWGGLFAVGLLVALIVPTAVSAFGPSEQGGPLVRWHKMDTSLLRVAADLFGIEPVELSNQMHEEKKNVFELAPDYGYAADDVVVAALEARAEVLAEAVEAGRITQERADKMLAGCGEQLETCAAGDCPHPGDKSPRERLRTARDQLKRVRRGMMNSAATLFGIDPEELAAELQERSSLLEVAKFHGFDTDDLIDAFMEDHGERLDLAVDEGKITPERAETMVERFTEVARRALEGEFNPQNGMRRQAAHRINDAFARLGGNLVEVTADLLDIEPDDVVDQLTEGATLADLLEENGLTAQDLADAYLEARASILEKLVEAGRITQERADQIMDAMESRIETALENGNWPPARPSV